jgi:hypothetical protein
LGSQALDTLGKASGFSQRKSKLTPRVFFDLLFYAVSHTQNTSLEYLVSCLESEYGISMSKQSLDERFIETNPDLSEYKIIEECEIIANKAFYGRKNLHQIYIPDGVTVIGFSAFELCEKLQRVTIPDSVTNIGKRCFDNCLQLQNIRLSNNITSIEEYTFFHCHALTRIDIPRSVTKIGYDAFYHCIGLMEIHSHNPNPPIIDVDCGGSFKKYADGFIGVNKSTCILYVPQSEFMNHAL